MKKRLEELSLHHSVVSSHHHTQLPPVSSTPPPPVVSAAAVLPSSSAARGAVSAAVPARAALPALVVAPTPPPAHNTSSGGGGGTLHDIQHPRPHVAPAGTSTYRITSVGSEMPHQITSYSSPLPSANSNQVVGATAAGVMTPTSVVLASGVGGGASQPIPHHGTAPQHHNAAPPQQVPAQQQATVPISVAAANVNSISQQQQQNMTPPQGQFQRLKVEDALSYLDQVKLRFGKQPQVYNDFLDIMKEFKSQTIDTPGVIARVSQLFRGHPELIVGFNTFLPPGYKIEVNLNVPGQHTTVVHTPQGTHEHVNPSPVVLQTPHILSTQQSPQQPPTQPQPTPTVSTGILTPAPSQAAPQTIVQTSAGGATVAPAGLALKPHGVLHAAQQGRGTAVLGVSSLSLTNSEATTVLPTAHVPQTVGTTLLLERSTVNSLSQQPQASLIQAANIAAAAVAAGGATTVQTASSQLLSAGVATMTPSHLSGAVEAAVAAAAATAASNHNSNAPVSGLLSTNTAPVNSSQQHRDGALGGLHPHQNPSQPVEFNHAINYVNKIKMRFHAQPDIYKQFLEILHTYQKEQRSIKEGTGQPIRQGTLTEKEVYEKVAKLFEHQRDLLLEFSQFLPDATNNQITATEYLMDLDQPNRVASHVLHQPAQLKPGVDQTSGVVGAGIQAAVAGVGPKKPSVVGGLPSSVLKTVSGGGSSPVSPHTNSVLGAATGPLPVISNKTLVSPPHHSPSHHSSMGGGGLYSSPNVNNQFKRSSNCAHPNQPPVKKAKPAYLKDLSLADAASYASLEEVHFFDQVRKTLRCKETYHNFLRCITLYNDEVISRSELLAVTLPFLQKYSNLSKWFEDFVTGASHDQHSGGPSMSSNEVVMSSSLNSSKQERLNEREMDIDLNTSKRIGASYCAVPPQWSSVSCSGKTPLCEEVLNNHWVSFPSWSEDATFLSSKKNQYEELIYRCEDERFELDVVLETNSSTMKVLEGVLRKMNRMSPEDAARFRLDDSLGGTSETIHQRAIRRIYGDKASDIIDGLKKNPMVAVPLVLRRLKLKDEEWREAQKNFNKLWREQNEKYYYKSLDHIGLTFKQVDHKMLKAKQFIHDMETLFDERHEQAEGRGGEVPPGPDMTLPYPPEKFIIDDAANLLIHHVKRQTTIHKEDKAKMKQLVRQFIPDMLFHARQELSDDEKDMDDEDEDDEDMDDSKSDHCEASSGSRGARDRECKQTSGGDGGASNDSSSGGGSNKRKTRSTKMSSSGSSSSSSSSSSGNDSNSKTSKPSDVKSTNSKDNKEDNTSGVISATNNNNDGETKIKEEKSKTVNGVVSDQERIQIKEEVIKKEDPDETEHSALGGNCPSDDEYRLFICSNSWYVFLRLHQILCHRLHVYYQHSLRLAAQEALDNNNVNHKTALMLRLKPKSEIPITACYPALLEMVRNLLDGHLDSTTYEDTLREIFTTNAYLAFTLDKVVNSAVRQLQHLVCDDIPAQCTSLFISEGRRGGAGGSLASAHLRQPLEQAYFKQVEKLLNDENCFKVYSYKRSCKITIELLDTEMAESEDGNGGNSASTPMDSSSAADGVKVEPGADSSSKTPGLPLPLIEAQRWSDYVDKYFAAGSEIPSLPRHMFGKALFLMRDLNSGIALTLKSNLHSRRDITIEDNTQCKINMSDMKVVFAALSSEFLCKKNALARARKCHPRVTVRKKEAFDGFHEKWLERHVPDANRTAVNTWLMGHSEGLRPNRTVAKVINAPDRTPYRPYNHYTYSLLDSVTSNSASNNNVTSSNNSNSSNNSSTSCSASNSGNNNSNSSSQQQSVS